MINSIQNAMNGYIIIYNSLPVSIRSFISLTLLLFIVAMVFKLLWRVKG